MSRTFHHGERRIRVKGVRRNQPDMKRLSRALIELAKAQAEADAQRVNDDPSGNSGNSGNSGSSTPDEHRESGDDRQRRRRKSS